MKKWGLLAIGVVILAISVSLVVLKINDQQTIKISDWIPTLREIGIKLGLKEKEVGQILPGSKVVTVSGWDSRLSDLSYRDQDGKINTHRLLLLETAVMTVEPNGERKIVIDILEPRWSSLFCRGDRLEMEIEGEKIKRIVNLGPRSCRQ